MQSANLLEDIFRIISDSQEPEKTLDLIVNRVAEHLGIDVCSVYLFDEKKKNLVLGATVGLRAGSVGRIKMNINQGLTGLVLEKMAPVFVIDPPSHPRYKYFEDSGEEIYRTFVGLPLVYHQQTLGVLVVQTIAPDAVKEEDLGVFTAVASQISATVAYSGLMEDLARERSQRLKLKQRLKATQTKGSVSPGRRRHLLRGTPVSPGVARGGAHYLAESIGFDQVECRLPEDVEREKQRLVEALQKTLFEIQDVIRRVKGISSQDAAILEVHLMLANDERFRQRLTESVIGENCAEYALKQVIQETMERFLVLDDPYLRERASDIEDVGKRVLRNLLHLQAGKMRKFERPTVVIAADISPVDLIDMRQSNLVGIVLTRGGKTSHTVLLAKSFEIPTITGMKHIVSAVKENDELIIDGTSGLVFRNPPPAIAEEYQRLKDEQQRQIKNLDALREIKACTRDGFTVAMGANISLLSDLELVNRCGADHIGLYRTEFPFLLRKSFPSEEEQLALYQKIVAACGQRQVCFRTLDVGGDKFLSYLDYPKEENPYLGWRSVRVSLELDDVFRTQLRAILRTSAFGQLKLLFPMITSTSELLKIVNILEEEKQGLRRKHIDYDATMPVGIMLEVPGTVKILGTLLKHIDFVSIGTNDLIQYTLAVDRNNEKVAPLYNPLHPAVIAVIAEVVAICKKHGKPVAVCGDAAASPACAILYLAMQVDQLSMNPAAVPMIKNMICKASLQEAQNALQAILAMDDEREIAEHLEAVCSRYLPDN